MTKNMRNFLSTPIAHRGLHSDSIPENTLTAFSRAIEHGYGIEFDVHLTADGHLVVIHDYNTARMCSENITIEKSPLSTIRALTLADGQHIPTLEEALSLVNGRVPIVIELKCTPLCDKNLANKVLTALEDYPNKDLVCLESFHPICVKYLKKHTDIYPVGQLATGCMVGMPRPLARYLGQLKMLRWNKADFVCYDILSLPSSHVERVRKQGIPILTYTINSYEKLALARTCTDNFIFERITLDSEG